MLTCEEAYTARRMACDTRRMANTDKRSEGEGEGELPGQWLRRQRERRGITSQAELARLLGWDKSTVNNYETRGVQVPDDRAEQLAEFFGLDILTVRRHLGLWVPKSGSVMDQAERDLDENERLVAEIRDLPPRDQRAAKAAVRAVIEALKENAENSGGRGKERH